MSRDADDRGGAAVPGRWSPLPEDAVERETRSVQSEVFRDGAWWPLGSAADVGWIASGTSTGVTIASAIPPVFPAYATILLPDDRDDQTRQDQAVLSVLGSQPAARSWWLGYLDTGADDVVFPDAPRVSLYWGWPYVLVQAGPAQAATWRRWDRGSFWSGQLPNLMFPTDHRWLVSTLWDDEWTCLGGPAALVDDLLRHPEIGSRARRVEPGEDATPPGHQAI